MQSRAITETDGRANLLVHVRPEHPHRLVGKRAEKPHYMIAVLIVLHDSSDENLNGGAAMLRR
jgi:hypothetical protein